MRLFSWIVRNFKIYVALSLALILCTVTAAVQLVNSNMIADREVALTRALGYFASSIDSGTTASRVMGAVMLLGAESPELSRLALHQAGANSATDGLLSRLRALYFAESAFVVDQHGRIAAFKSEDRFDAVGRDVAFLPFVKSAMNGAANVYPAANFHNGDRSIFLAAPIRRNADGQAPAVGVVGVTISSAKLDQLLQTWTNGPVVLISPQGVVFASNRPGWELRATANVSKETLDAVRLSRQFGDAFEKASAEPLPFAVDSSEAVLDGVVHTVRNLSVDWDDPSGEWSLLIFDAHQPWWRQWQLVAAGAMAAVIVVALCLWLYFLARNAVLQRKAYQATENAERRLRELTDNAPVAVYQKWIGDGGRCDFRFVSRRVEAILGVSQESLLSDPEYLFGYMQPESAQKYRSAVLAAVSQKAVWDQEFQLCINGDERWVHSVAYPMVAADGTLSYNGFFEDVTARKAIVEEMRQARELAEEATKTKSFFLANMSHEIRTPMNGVIGMAYLALKTELTAKQRDYISKIHHAGNSLLGIINDILDFSKIEAGMLSIEQSDFNLEEVFGNVSAIVSHKMVERGLEFVVNLNSEVPCSLKGDSLRLGQILTNLLNNAVKFTNAGEITLNCELLERMGERVKLSFSIRDTGIGMSAEQSSRLFQPFVQADVSTSRKYGGTGLGLTICKRLVELMGGQIWVDSKQGEGSTFSFTVWLDQGEATAAIDNALEKLQGLKILVVDDNFTAREVLMDLLKDLPCSAQSVVSGDEAVALLRDQASAYDVVLMDWRMPGMDGVEAARIIRSDPSIVHKPAIVMVTAFSTDDVQDQDGAEDFDGFLLKPVSRQMLVRTLHALVDVGGQQTLLSGPEGSLFPRHALSGLSVLLAEDNEINQQIAVELLTDAGCRVDLANNGREVIEKAMALPDEAMWDVILMDLQMPEMDGFQATAWLRADARFATLPVIALTAHAMVEERQRCLDAGMNGHITKPIDPDVLFRTLGQWLPESALAALPKESADTELCLPEIPGMDVAGGMKRVAGNLRLYRSLLAQFCDRQADSAGDLRAALEKCDADEAKRVVHTVKGVAANLGAQELAEVAAALETELKSQYPDGGLQPALTPLVLAFDQTLSRTVFSLRTWLAEDAAAAAPEPVLGQGPTADELARLAQLLADDDGDAPEYFESLRPALAAWLNKEELAALADDVASYDFSAALARLQGYQSR